MATPPVTPGRGDEPLIISDEDSTERRGYPRRGGERQDRRFESGPSPTPADEPRTRRLAYADPPYPGQAASRYDGREVNHRLLIAYLDEFDGWALSTSTSFLRDVWNLCPHARCAAWVKTYAINGWSRIRYSWEPVLFVADHKGLKPGEASKVWDSIVCSPDTSSNYVTATGKRYGVKPYTFIRWILDLLDYHEGDEVVDIFPGSGAVARAVDHEQPELFNDEFVSAPVGLAGSSAAGADTPSCLVGELADG